MKVITLKSLENTDRQVRCPKGEFTSNRFLLESDAMGYTITKTIIPKGVVGHWHYKNHLESCYCIKGSAVLSASGMHGSHFINEDTLYVLDEHDEHWLEALEETHLICVFNPPLKGKEIHKNDGSYEV